MSKKNKINITYNQVEINQKSETNYYDVISLSFIVGLFVIDFLPLFKSIEILGPQYIYLSILNIIIGLYIFNNPLLISENLIAFCKKSLVLKFYFVFIALCGISVFFAKNTSLGIVNFSRLLIILFTLLNLIVLFYNRLHLIYRIALIISLSLFIQSFSEINEFIKTVKTGSYVAALIDLKGNTGSINILASSLCLKIPFVLISIIHFKKWIQWFLILTLFLAVTLIFLSGSRATYISLFLEIILFSIIFLKMNTEKKAGIFKICLIIIPIIFSFFISNQVLKSSKTKGRYESVTNRVKQVTNIESSSSNIRLLYWKNAAKMIQDNPITGIGLGNWKTESIPYEKIISKDRKISNNTHNDFIEITTETGILNGIIYLSIFILLSMINLKIVLKSEKQNTTIVALVSFLLLVSYAVDAFFNFPFYRPTMQLGFCLFFALTLINVSQIQETKSNDFGKKYAILLIVISILTAYISYKIFKAYQLENSIRSNFATKNFNLKAGDIVSKLPNYPNVFTSGEPFATYAGKYFVLEKNYKQAQKYLNIGHKINPYLGRTEYYKSNIAKETGNLDSAYIYSKKALEIRPRTRDYYIGAVNAANTIKDTLAILQIHKIYIEYNNNPEVWINTSSALNNSKYSTKKLIQFIDEGLKHFPENAELIERRGLFKSNSKKINSNNYTKEAIQFYKEKNYIKALEALEKALKIDPNNPKVIKNIAICKTMIK
ncbi:O-antigen ligase family protein [Flavobacterium sp.]|uniref:O-antigen ligase family protein n=1 Tax=Flavobacterium sp. TaxID=239 RepID=UPI0038FC84BB